jgi:type III secretion protein J
MKRAWAVAACALVLSCERADVYSDLSERQANEIVAALQTAGVEASKVEGEPERWTIRVAQEDFIEAVRLLEAQGLPREDFTSLGEIFEKRSFVSSPLEERARYVYGLSQELSETISSIDGVITARVHLAAPEQEPLSDETKPASASVFIKHRPGVDLSAEVAQLKALVVNSVEGLSYDNVTVALFPAESASAAQTAASADEAMLGSSESRPLFVAVVGAMAVLALAVPLAGFVRRRPPPRDKVTWRLAKPTESARERRDATIE